MNRISILPLTTLASGLTGYGVGILIGSSAKRCAALLAIYNIANTFLFHISYGLLKRWQFSAKGVYTFTNPLIVTITIVASRKFDLLTEKQAAIFHLLNTINFMTNMISLYNLNQKKAARFVRV